MHNRVNLLGSYVFLLFSIILLTTSCSRKQPKFTIAVSQCSEDIWREKLKEELITTAYIYDNVQLEFATARDNDKLQQQQIDSFINQGVDLLVISPNQLNSVTPTIERAYKKGIPVVLFDRKSESAHYTAFMGADNYEIGLTMGKYIAGLCGGKGRVAEIRGLNNSSPAIDRHRGLVDALSQYPNMRLVDSQPGDWTEASGERVMRGMLAKNEDFDCVFGQNDRMALGARKVMRQQRPSSKTKFVGIDALSTPQGGIRAVKDGKLDASYIYPTRGDKLLQLCMNILEGRPYQKENMLEAAIVTPNNAEVMLMQADEMSKQTEHLRQLHSQVDQFLTKYNYQKVFLILVIIILSLLLMVLFMVYRGVVMRRHMAEEAANAKLKFFTNVSHELRTPLTLITAPVEQLSADPTLSDGQRSLLSVVQRNTDILLRLVNEILDFRKVQDGKMQLHLAHFDLVPSLKQWAEMFEPATKKKNITLHVETPAHLFVMSDAYKLERICYNLLSNSVKYTPEGGEIWMRVQQENERFNIIVEDSGIGIPEDKLKSIFERFFQVETPYTNGTGVGLALVKAFTQMLHGSVVASNREPKGARFTVDFPVEQPNAGEVADENKVEEQHQQTKSEEALSLKETADALTSSEEKEPRKHILVVDDNADIRTYLTSWLSKYYYVSCAADGKEGFETARREVPDLVLSDVMMPVMDGLELCRKLKADMATSHIPVLLLTARDMDESRADAYNCGADGYIVKPFNDQVLLARVKNLIDSRQQLRNLFGGDTDNSDQNNQDRNFTDKLREAIQQNLGDSDFSIEQLGGELGLSRVQLYRKVKAMTGHSPVEILREARLRRADHLLATTDKTVAEIAYEVGFSSPSYFAKCYKDMFGHTAKK
ncbi:MAG: substrate-binding domain-containing protein [Prevotella sp.]|jgi:signal transduction histidine kinase/DNA-binding response OmpR family regulator/ABC-type xylose transport system substrate-binding protein